VEMAEGMFIPKTYPRFSKESRTRSCFVLDIKSLNES
jgi:hypothetical protein